MQPPLRWFVHVLFQDFICGACPWGAGGGWKAKRAAFLVKYLGARDGASPAAASKCPGLNAPKRSRQRRQVGQGAPAPPRPGTSGRGGPHGPPAPEPEGGAQDPVAAPRPRAGRAAVCSAARRAPARGARAARRPAQAEHPPPWRVPRARARRPCSSCCSRCRCCSEPVSVVGADAGPLGPRRLGAAGGRGGSDAAPQPGPRRRALRAWELEQEARGREGAGLHCRRSFSTVVD